MNKKLISLLGLLISLVFLNVAKAATFDVTVTDDSLSDGICSATMGDGICTLREAIILANNMVGADVINLTVEGDYKIMIGPGAEDLEIGLIAEGGDFDITDSVTINGLSPSQTSIDGNFLDRVIHVSSAGSTVVIQNVTIKNGTIPEAPMVFGLGAGIYVSDINEFSLIDSELVNNRNNDSAGGGIFIELAGSFLISRSTIANNYALVNNIGGGGLVVNADGIIENSTISANETDSGFATAIYGPSAPLEVNILNSTVVKNFPHGIAVGGTGVRINNSIIVNNTENINAEYFDVADHVVSDGYNFISSASPDFQASTGDQVGTAGNIVDPLRNILDARLGDLIDNGGLTRTHLPLADSPVVNAGLNSDCPATDQRGESRNFDANCDIGSVEVLINCGDGNPDPDEECDLGAESNGQVESTCSSLCTIKEANQKDINCGNGIVDEIEQCDFNAPDAPENCLETCQLSTTEPPPGNQDSGGCYLTSSTSFSYFYLSAISVILGWVVVRPRIVKQHGGNETR